MGQKINNDIAIIGIGCRFPGANNYERYWDNLIEAKSSISEIPKERWDWKKYYNLAHSDKKVSKWGGFIEEADIFDTTFFNISNREADAMDPQQRIMLELAWGCFEDAGICQTEVSGKNIGVFIAAFNFDFKELVERNEREIEPHYATGLAATIIPNRISYYFNLKGPSLAMDNACSGSLSAIHVACQSIINGECEMALAGGVNLILSPSRQISFSQMGMMSKTGSCKTLDSSADGYVRGEGAGIILLAPLEKAIAESFPIHGVIKGSAINHSGKTHTITYPSSEAQANVIIEAMNKSGLSAEDIDYVELHGTGTPKGDPIEFEGLARAFQVTSSEQPTNDVTKYCGIGSTKTNIGHLEAAAGVAGVIKVLLSMEHGYLPQILNYHELNPRIKMENTPFYIIDKVKKWQHDYEKAVPRRAGVSSFGFGGTNAHLILEEAPVRNNQSNSEARYYMLVLSAKTQDALERQERQLLSWLEKHEEAALCDICTTLMIGREHFEERLAIVADSKEKVMETLRQLMNKEEYIEDTYMTQSVDGDKEGICYESIGDIQDVHSLKYKDLLKEVASFYVRGGKVDWSKLAIAKRINMPTYPFEKEKCWMPKVEYVEKAIAYEENLAYDTMADTSSVADVVSVVEKWELKDINLGEKDIKTILVVSEDCGISQELEKYIALAQKKVNVINANAYDQFKSSFKAIGQNFKNIDVVLYVTNGKALSDETQLIDMLRSIGNSGLQIGRMILAASYKTLLERCYIESWIALERTIQLILPKMQFNVLSIEEVAINKEEFSNILWKEMHNTIAQSVRYEAEGRKVRVIKEEQIIEEVQPVLKKHGVYVIIGGLGAIGQILAGYLAEKYDAKLILVGRRDQEEAQSKLEKAHLLTSNVLYDQTDICNVQELRQVIEEGKKNFGHIDGVMHIAGIEGKGNLLNNTVEDYKRVVLPKIKGTLALTECLKDESLDFICYFSSCSAIIGDFGSCDYAVGNRFMMNYGAYYKEQLHSKGSNTKIVVINWPLWRNGGMCNADQMASQMYLKSSGQVFLENKQGMRLFDLLLRQKEMSYTIFVGDRQRILTFLESKSKSRDKALDKGEKMQITEVIKDMVKESLIEDLKKIINRILRVPVEKLKLDKTLAEFGFDSVGLSEFADELSEYYSIRVTPDMFFSYPSIDKVAEYLISQYESQINQFYKKEVKEAPEEEESSIVSPKEESLENSNTLIDTDEIAVIGMSGRFPAARNIEDLWDILAQGKEVLQKMPSDRKEWHESEDNNVGVIPGVAEFDPLFFEILPIDAEKMDPKQRLLLQETWKALEDAGYNKKLLETEKIGMFVGVEEGDYISKDNDLVSNHNGILAARIGYLLNFSGPIMAINTACSSGLVALHQACQSIRNGECDTAVVAGANLMITPKGYENMKKIGMISKDGKCRAFDNRSQGMVPAEAIGVVVLKKKAKAQLDCHSIYATVIGSGINYDGKTNSITAPSGIAQANLLRDVYTRYHINPKDISYVVTHGTGTKLGDPIEVNALKEVFNGYTDNRQYCALTSTKPNIGHALAASGIVSFISLMLAMKEGIIPPTINCEEPNAYIEWQDSPFYLNRQRKAWTNNQRIGAVSAFGMSGTNAHVVAKNYIQPKETSNSNLAYALLVFSAKDEAVLEQNIENIITFMKDNEALDLASLSYSLLEGRMHFTYRYAIVANSVKQAIEMLTNRRSIKADTLVKSKQSMDLKASTQREINQLVEEISLEEDSCKEALCRLARLYGEGYEINGDKLFDQYAVRRLHIPTYVFLRENYWFEQKEQVREERQLHPLVHSNQSTLMKQCYKARFKKDNQVLQQIIGQEKSHSMIAYLEMINFAVKDALRDELDNNQQILIKDIKVLEDLELKNGALDIQIELQASDEDELAFNIYDQLEQKVYCQGNAQIVSSEEIGYEDLTKLKEQCTQEVNTEVLGMTKVYKGPSSILGKVEYAGQDTQEEALQIKPSILKQAFALVNYFEQDKVKTISIDACDISMISSNEVWIYINHIDSHSVNISLFGQDGAPYLRLSGYHYTKLEQIKESSNYKKISKLLMPQWTKIDTKGTKLNLENALVIGQTCDIPMNLLSQKMQIWDVDYTTSSIDDLALQLQKCNAIQHIIWFVSREHLRDSVSTQIVKQQEKGTLFLFRLTKALMQLGYHHQPLELTIVTYSTQKVLESDWFNPTHSGLHGLAQVIDKEIPHWHINVIDTDDASYNAINMSQEELVAYRNKQAYKKVFKEVKLENMTSDRKAYCKNGVYVVIGGAGGVGEVWSEYMIRTYQAQIIWIGRRKLNDQIREKITRLSALGPKIHYISADATCLDEMEAAYKEIKQIYPRVNGVVHSAVGALDKSVLHMDEQLYKTITQIKVDTSVYIARVFKDETLDFILYFSSIAAINKFAGQAGYVTGCVFEDAYAEYLDSLWQCKVKTINWGYWGTIGIGQAMPETFKTKLALSGIEAVMPTEAMQQLERFMDTKACQMAYECTSKLQEEEVESVEDCNARENIALQLKEIIGGYINIPASQIELDVDLEEYAIDSYMLDQLTDKLSQWFSQVDQQALLKYRTIGDMAEYLMRYCTKTQEASRVTQVETIMPKAKLVEEAALETSSEIDNLLLEKTISYVKKLVGDTLKIPYKQIETYVGLEKYGIDSIAVEYLTYAFEKIFDGITSTTFFEYQSVNELAQYLVSTQRNKLLELFNMKTTKETSKKEQVVEATIQNKKQATHQFKKAWHKVNQSYKQAQDMPIAIIGISGRFPQAHNINEFWENLKAGKDSIVEIPKKRWSLDGFYVNDIKQAIEQRRSYCKWGGFIDGFEEFDPLFFKISPREAMNMDPQERLMLQECWATLEDSGYTKERISKKYKGNVGVFIGITRTGFELYSPDLWRQGQNVHLSTSFSSVANRISYVLDLHGPSLPIDTMCSSSLSALHEACEHLRRGECDMSLVGGVNIYTHPSIYVLFCEKRMLSIDGRCKSFGKGANGFVPGEGVVSMLLKPLDKAIADGDHIYAVIQGTAVNHGGKTNGYTVPNPNAQRDVVRKALDRSGISARTISYVEAHGTGTELGDPIEINGLTQAYSNDTKERQYCAIGSAKSNIGHLEGAAGIVGVVKCVLQMQHKLLVPSLHAQELNPKIDFKNSPFYVQRELSNWNRPIIEGKEYPRIAGVSAFGAGGANAHAIIREYIREGKN